MLYNTFYSYMLPIISAVGPSPKYATQLEVEVTYDAAAIRKCY